MNPRHPSNDPHGQRLTAELDQWLTDLATLASDQRQGLDPDQPLARVLPFPRRIATHATGLEQSLIDGWCHAINPNNLLPPDEQMTACARSVLAHPDLQDIRRALVTLCGVTYTRDVLVAVGLNAHTIEWVLATHAPETGTL